MQYRRTRLAGATYFIIVNLLDRKKKLLVDNILFLRQAFSRVKINHPFVLEAAVVLPDHLHILMSLPEHDVNYSQRLSLIKGYFSRSIKKEERVSKSREKKRERGIWQRRFWEHAIQGERDYRKHVDYIHYNPVKHGYVRRATDWRYSSIHQHISKGLLLPNWGEGLHEVEGSFGE